MFFQVRPSRPPAWRPSAEGACTADCTADGRHGFRRGRTETFSGSLSEDRLGTGSGGSGALQIHQGKCEVPTLPHHHHRHVTESSREWQHMHAVSFYA